MSIRVLAMAVLLGAWAPGVALACHETDATCDGVDDDCDGHTDEDYAPLATTCGVGACASSGVTSCVAGVELDSCVQGSASDELCDALDNDCDGLTDAQDADLLVVPCNLQEGVCAGSMRPVSTCVDGAWRPCEGAVYAGWAFVNGFAYAADDTTCDDVDNDCDGSTDDDFAPVVSTCGAGACVATGTLSCVGGSLVNDCTPKPAAPEVCDGVDNDCDGARDAADPDLVVIPCDRQQGVCAGAARPASACVGGNWKACDAGTYAGWALAQGGAPYQLEDASCDAADNDCDGNTDEDFDAAVVTCGVGICAGNTGLQVCSEGVVSEICDPLAGAATEICNDLDDDCDGTTDLAVDGAPLCPPPDTIAACPDPIVGYTDVSVNYADPDAPAWTEFECSVDGGPWQICPSGGVTLSVGQGQHTFLVRTLGADGLIDPTPAYCVWSVDVSQPDTTCKVFPQSPLQTPTAQVAFDSNVPAGDVAFFCALDPPQPLPDALPSCDSEEVFADLTDGPHRVCGYAVNDAGTRDPTPACCDLLVDTTPPETVAICPPALLAGLPLQVTFYDPDDADVTRFECRLDQADWTSCDGGQVSYGDLADGHHVVLVRALDQHGLADPTPAQCFVNLDTTAPQTFCASVPALTVPIGSASIGLGASEAAVSFRCALVSSGTAATLSDYAPCDATVALSDLADGDWELWAVATDAAGHSDATPAICGFSVDATSPETTLLDHPPSKTSLGLRADFSYASPNDPSAVFECRLDDGPWGDCADSISYPSAALPVGTHVFEVRACEAVHCDLSPAGWIWEVVDSACPLDDAAPELTCAERLDIECDDGGATVDPSTFTPTVIDACSALNVTTSQGERFDTGTTPVVWSAIDGNGNVASCLTVVAVSDSEPPTLSCANHVALPTDPGRCDAAFALAPPVVSDTCDPEPELLGTAPGRFPVGATTVSWWATDDAGHTAACETTVSVSDVEPVTITCAEALDRDALPTVCGWSGAVGATASDNCSNALSLGEQPRFYPIGQTTVVFAAQDQAGNASKCETRVFVRDSTPPTIACGPKTKTGVAISATDACEVELEMTWSCFAVHNGQRAAALDASECPFERAGNELKKTGQLGEFVELELVASAADSSQNSAQVTCVERFPADAPASEAGAGDDGCTSARPTAPLPALLLLLLLLLARPKGLSKNN